MKIVKKITMPQRISTVLNVSEQDLNKYGVFNSFIDIDSKLYIDPCLLEGINIEEFSESYQNFKKYFSDLLSIIKCIKKPNDVFWNGAVKKLQFKEFKYVGLGYATNDKQGNGIGRKLAIDLLDTAQEILKAGISDPVIFELIGLIQKNISLDRISDMTIHIIRQELISYTENVSKKLNIKTQVFAKKYALPYNSKTRTPIIFIPKKLLRDIPIALSWEDIDMVYSETENLKTSINELIGKSWREVIKNGKGYVREVLLNNPEAFRDLIIQYKKKPRIEYDFENDPLGEILWAELAEKAGENHPIDFTKKGIIEVTSENILIIAKIICEQYAKLVENNGWFEFLYNNDGKLRNERFAQKLLYGIADVYCRSNNLNLTRESNAGSGALDFKLTKGYSDVVSVELKYSSNSNLVKGFLKQLPTYNKSENATNSIYLVIKVTDSDTSIKKIVEQAEKLKNEGAENAPDIIIVDGRKQISASKRR